MANHLFLSSLLLLALVSAISAQPPYQAVPVGQLNSPAVVDAATAAIKKYNQETGSNIGLVTIVRALTAVFEGKHWYQMVIKVYEYRRQHHDNDAINAVPVSTYDIEFHIKEGHLTIVRFRAE